MCKSNLHSFKNKIRDKILMYGQDFLINRIKPSNAGVIMIDIKGFAREWPNILAWGSSLPRNKFPEHDQLWLNRYHYSDPKKWKRQNILLPQQFNWKVYWQLEPNAFEDIKIVHFHGPKPGAGVEVIAECNVEAYELVPESYKMFIQHAICCDSGTTANSVLSIYKCLNHTSFVEVMY